MSSDHYRAVWKIHVCMSGVVFRWINSQNRYCCGGLKHGYSYHLLRAMRRVWCMRFSIVPAGGITPKLWPRQNWNITMTSRHGASNHQQLDGLFNYLFKLTSKKTSKSALLALCAGNQPVTGWFPPQRAGNAKSGSNAWRHNEINHVLSMEIRTLTF